MSDMSASQLRGGVTDLNLNDYKKNATLNAHQKKRYELVTKLLKQVPQPGKGLDYGSGLGDLAYHVSGYFDSLIGVDVSAERVAWANAEFAPVQFFQCDRNKLDYPDSSFNTVISSVVINWTRDPRQYLENIFGVLTPGGHLVLVVAGANLIRNSIRRLIGKAPADDASHKLLDVDTMTKMLNDLNFKIVSIDCYYDPAADVLNSPKNVLLEIIKFPMRVLRVPTYADYYGILVQKTDA